jgi:hypothetical protein
VSALEIRVSSVSAAVVSINNVVSVLSEQVSAVNTSVINAAFVSINNAVSALEVRVSGVSATTSTLTAAITSVNAVVSLKVNRSGDIMTGNLTVPTLVIQSSGGGSVTLDVPNTASNFTATLPLLTGSITIIPSGTAMLFAQSAAPTGWTKSTTHNDKALRVVSGTAGSGGSVAFTAAFASQAVSGTVGNTTLTTSQIPSHNHNIGAYSSSNEAGGYGLTITGGFQNRVMVDTATGQASNNTGGGGSHNHSFTGTAIDLAVQYVDVIIATKD